MSYLLDTNVVVRYLNGRSPSVTRHLGLVLRPEVFVSAILVQELAYGLNKRGTPSAYAAAQESFLRWFTSLPFANACATTAGKLRAELERLGTPIGPYDLQIAGIALAHDLTLVTHNTREFSRVPGLRLEDWEAE